MVTEHKLTIRAKINPILKILHQYRYEVALKYIKISERAAGRKSEIVAFDHISCMITNYYLCTCSKTLEFCPRTGKKNYFRKEKVTVAQKLWKAL